MKRDLKKDLEIFYMTVNKSRDDEDMKQEIRLNTVRRLFSYLKPYRGEVIGALVLMGLVVSVELLNPYFIKTGIDVYIRNKDWAGLLMLGGGMIALNAAAMVFTRKGSASWLP